MNDYNNCRILLSRGRGLISTLIRWQTRGEYSHAAILYPDGETIIEAWQGDGVRKKKITDWKDVDTFAVTNITAEQWKAAIELAEHQLGKGYDYWAIIRFISRGIMPDNDKWFCSELVMHVLRAFGVNLFLRIEPWAVSPGMLNNSPVLYRTATDRSEFAKAA